MNDVKVKGGLLVIRRYTTIFTMLCLLLSTVNTAFAADVTSQMERSEFKDMAGHWAERQLSEWVDNGLIQGFPDQTIRPDQVITRAEMAALVNRVFGFTEAEPDWLAVDLAVTNWAYHDMSAAVRAGYLEGYEDGTVRAKRSVSREEAAVMITRLLSSDLAPNEEAAEAFMDANQMADWSKGAIGAAAAGKLLLGYKDGSFKPRNGVTRAEAVVLLDRVLTGSGLSYSKAGTYGPVKGTTTVKGNVSINVPGVILQNMIISGNLLIGEGVGEGDVKLKNVTVKGKTTLNGGGEHSVYFIDTVLNIVQVDKKTGTIRIVLEGSSTITELILQSQSVIETGLVNSSGEGIGVLTLADVLPVGSKIILKGSFKKVEVKSKGSEIQVVGGIITELIISDQASGTKLTLDKDSKIFSLFLNEIIKVLGQGEINKVIYGKKGKGSTFERMPKQTEELEGTDPVDGGPSNPTPTPTPTATPTPTSTAFIVKEGIPNADIIVSQLASKMEMLAAEELQSTIKMVSGAELPVYKGQIDGNLVSAQLWEDVLDINKSGTFPIHISLINNSNHAVQISMRQMDNGPITVNTMNGIVLGAKQGQNIDGTIAVPVTITEGTHSVSIEVSYDDVPVTILTLTVNIDRNLIKNGGFEKASASGNTPEDWIVPSGARDNQVARSGTSSLRIDLGEHEYINATTNQRLILERGREYELRAWVKGSAPSGQKVVTQFMEMKNDGGYKDGSGQQVSDVTDQWTLVKLKYTPKQTAVFDYNWIYFYAIAGTDQLWIDDVTLMEIGEEPEPSQNLITNPGFETATANGELPVGWNVPSGVRDNQIARSGTSSLRIDLGEREYIYAVTDQQIKLRAGQEYTLQAWVKGSAASGQKVIGQFMEMGNDWTNSPGTQQIIFNVTDTWSKVEMKYTPDATKQLDYVWIYFYIVAGTDQLWIDDVSLTLTESEPLKMDSLLAENSPQLELQTSVMSPEVRTLSLESEIEADRYQIILGTPDTIPDLASQFGDDLAYLQNSDGFAIRKVGNRIYIIGTEDKGVLNGVYDFLEENAGVLWTRSSTTDIGTLYDELDTINVEKINYREKSPFQLRGWNLTGYGANGEYHEDPGTESMMARNKMNAKMAEFENQPLWERHERVGVKSFTLGHNLGYWLPNELYFSDHPDYYNMDVAGEKYIPVADDTQINFYHPDVPGVIAGRVKQFLVDNPIEYVGIGINDTHYFEQGTLSRTPFTTEDHIVIQPNEADYKSTVFYSFLNKIAAEVKVTNPNVKIVTFAYFFSDVPPRVKLEDNIVVVLAPLTGDDRVPFNTSDVENSNYNHRLKLLTWLDKTKNLVMYNYYGSFLSNTYERPIAEKVQADMQYYSELGITGVMPEGVIDARIPNWSINALQFWLFQKLMWNPDADIEQLKSDYIRKAYGAAADSMRTYYDLIEQGWNKFDDPIGYNTSTNTYIGKYIIKAGIKDAAQQALNQAWALANDKEKARIAPIKTTFEKMVREITELPYLEARAVKTTTAKEDIISATDFSQGPWAAATPITEFYVMSSKNPAPVKTKVRLLWDNKNLYVGYENFDDNISNIVASDVGPNEWWTGGPDDDNETFITGHPAAASYYVFFNNSKAMKLEYSGPTQNSGYSGEWEAYTSVGTDRWMTIQVIPFASINVDLSITKTLQGYFFRTYHKTGFYGWGVGAVWSSSDFHPILLEE